MNKGRIKELKKEIELHQETIDKAIIHFDIGLIEPNNYHETIKTYTLAIRECESQIKSLAED